MCFMSAKVGSRVALFVAGVDDCCARGCFGADTPLDAPIDYCTSYPLNLHGHLWRCGVSIRARLI